MLVVFSGLGAHAMLGLTEVRTALYVGVWMKTCFMMQCQMTSVDVTVGYYLEFTRVHFLPVIH